MSINWDNVATLRAYHDAIHRHKLAVGCSICGGKDFLVYHHIEPLQKLWDVSGPREVREEAEKRKLSRFAVLRAEVEKCDVLCEKCHIKVHKELGKDYKQASEYMRVVKHMRNEKACSNIHFCGGKQSKQRRH